MVSRRSYAKGIAKRDEILRAGLAVFAEKGYLHTSIRELAEAANLSQAGLLHYFGSKEELLVAILRRREEENAAKDSTVEPLDNFINVIHGNVTVPGLAQLFAVMSTAATDESHPAHEFFLERNAHLRSLFSASIRHRQAAGELDAAIDPERVATILIAVADGLQTQWLTDERVDMAGALDYLWELLHSVSPRGE
ncbi:TetR/AcrR family transcriptional regulator [Microbacterium tumbae]